WIDSFTRSVLSCVCLVRLLSDGLGVRTAARAIAAMDSACRLVIVSTMDQNDGKAMLTIPPPSVGSSKAIVGSGVSSSSVGSDAGGGQFRLN
uniref:Secreted protein n=1 Tax=Macrostomum lignano TaxID=282301 RepID=A0A1I8FD47_9PLAT